MADDLDPLAPEDGVKLYLQQRRDEVSDETMQSHRYRLSAFVEWCRAEGITNLNDLGGRDLHAYRVHRSEDSDLAPITLQGQLSTLRVFLRFCVSLDAVPEELPEKVMLPTVRGDREISKTTFDPERAKKAIDYLARFHYASRAHALFLLLWTTGMRVGAAPAIDPRLGEK